MTRYEAGKVLSDTSNELFLDLSIMRMSSYEPISMRVFIPPTTKCKSHGFRYKTEYFVSSAEEGSPLQCGDHIVKVIK